MTPSTPLHSSVLLETEENTVSTVSDITIAIAPQGDVARLYQKKDETEWLGVLLKATASAIWSWDLKRNRFWWSPEVYRLLGLTDSDEIPPGNPFNTRIHPEDYSSFVDALLTAIAMRQEGQAEFRLVQDDGRICWLRDHWRVKCDEQGEASLLLGVLTDITAPKKAETSLRRSKERYRSLVENATDIIYATDLNGRIVAWNKAGEKITGYTREETVSLTLRQLIAPESLPRVEALIDRQITQGRIVMAEVEIRGKDGRRIILEVNSRARLENGRPAGIEGIARDVTERKRAAAALQESEQKFAELVNSLNGIVWEGNAAGVTFISSQAEKILGHPVAEWLGDKKFWLNHIHPEDRERVAKFSATASKAEETCEMEYRMFSADGRTVWLKDLVTVIREEGQPVKLRGFTLDITEQQQALQELRRREQLYDALAKATALTVWMSNADGSEVKELQGPAELSGPSPGRGQEWPWLRNVNEQDKKRVGQALCRSLAEGKPFETEYAITSANHDKRYLVARGVPVRRQDGNIREWVGTFTDVTAKKRVEEALRQSERRFRSLFDQSPLGICVLRANKPVYVNSALAEMVKADIAELHSLPILNWVAPEERARVAENIHLRNQGHPVPTNYEVTGQRANGEQFPLQIQVGLLELPDGPAWLVYLSDLTAQRATQKALQHSEEQLRQAQKLESIGRLAGGIAHDFNNLLTVINGNSDLMMMHLAEDSKEWHQVEQIHKAGLRAADLTRQLLAFSRKQILQPRVLNLNTIINNVGKMLQRLIGEDIELEINLQENLQDIQADPTQIEQVLLNLAVNGRDAMPQGGKLRISTENAYLDSGYSFNHNTVVPGPYIRLTVSDTGCGIPADIREEIFEPFFTTKEDGKGTGLGLSTVYGIVRQSGGYIWVYSEMELGSTFKIYLPCLESALSLPILPTLCEHNKTSGQETILLLEDDEKVRNLVKIMLQLNGYSVLEAENGEKALELGRRATEPIHLLLTDVVMPRQSGPEMAAQLLKLRPDLRVLYMSGYATEQIAGYAQLIAGAPFIEKPFSMRDLARKVRQTMELAAA